MELNKIRNFFSKNKNITPSKTGLKDIKELSIIDYSRFPSSGSVKEFVFFKHENGFRYDFLLSKKRLKKLFVLFSGYADRNKLDPPVFQRWKWAEKFPGSVLYISDPSLYLNKSLSLGWYIGTKDVDHYTVISKTIMSVADQLKVSPFDIVSYGSSGGGFASIRLADFIPEITSVAINPQTEIKKYSQKTTINKYLKVCFQESYKQFDFDTYRERFSLIKNSNLLSDRRVILAQNTLDKHHFYEHYLPYCAIRGVDGAHNVGNSYFKTILFENRDGHSGAETRQVFREIMRSISK